MGKPKSKKESHTYSLLESRKVKSFSVAIAKVGGWGHVPPSPSKNGCHTTTSRMMGFPDER